jgi:hypothetical protein
MALFVPQMTRALERRFDEGIREEKYCSIFDNLSCRVLFIQVAIKKVSNVFADLIDAKVLT